MTDLDIAVGDLVEVTHVGWGEGNPITGRVYLLGGMPYVGGWSISQAADSSLMTVKVVERGPRPFYTNSDRLEPHEGDVAVGKDGFALVITARVASDGFMRGKMWGRQQGTWCHGEPKHMREKYGPLRLLVDGTTGKVVE